MTAEMAGVPDVGLRVGELVVGAVARVAGVTVEVGATTRSVVVGAGMVVVGIVVVGMVERSSRMKSTASLRVSKRGRSSIRSTLSSVRMSRDGPVFSSVGANHKMPSVWPL